MIISMSTTTSTARPARTDAKAYGLSRPTVVDARAALERVYGPMADTCWTTLASRAQTSKDRAVTVEGVVDAMLAHEDGVVRLCGQALKIRLRSFTHLSAANAMVS